MAKILLHIGAEKCGSSSIQRFLAQNRRELMKRHILVPSCFGYLNHTKLAAYAQRDDKFDSLRRLLGVTNGNALGEFRDRVRREFHKDVYRRKNVDLLVLSNEHCSSRLQSNAEVECLRDLLYGVTKDIEIVLYVRPQDEALVSAYSTEIKSGSIRDFEFPNTMGGASYSMKYYQICRLWANVFGRENIKVVPIHKSEYGVSDVAYSFASLLGVADISGQYSDKSNTSLDVCKLRFLIELNKEMKLFESSGFNRTRARIVSSLERSPHICKKMAAPWIDRKKVLRLFSEGNSMLFREFLGIEDNVFAMPADDRPPVSVPDQLEQSDIVKIIVQMLRDYDAHYVEQG